MPPRPAAARGAARPGDDLPEVPGEGAGEALRHGRRRWPTTCGGSWLASRSGPGRSAGWSGREVGPAAPGRGRPDRVGRPGDRPGGWGLVTWQWREAMRTEAGTPSKPARGRAEGGCRAVCARRRPGGPRRRRGSSGSGPKPTCTCSTISLAACELLAGNAGRVEELLAGCPLRPARLGVALPQAAADDRPADAHPATLRQVGRSRPSARTARRWSPAARRDRAAVGRGPPGSGWIEPAGAWPRPPRPGHGVAFQPRRQAAGLGVRRRERASSGTPPPAGGRHAPRPAAGVSRVAFSPDGQRLAAGRPGPARCRSGTRPRAGGPSPSAATPAAVVARRLQPGRPAAGLRQRRPRRTVRVWDAATGKEVCPPLKGHSDDVTGRGTSAPTASAWPRPARTRRSRLGRPDGPAAPAPTRSHHGHVPAWLSARTASAWPRRVRTRRFGFGAAPEAVTLRGHAGRVTAVAFSPDGRRACRRPTRTGS